LMMCRTRMRRKSRDHEIMRGNPIYRHNFCAGIYIDDLDFFKSLNIIEL
jgi:hypothetical protein